MNISAWLEFEWQYQKKNSAVIIREIVCCSFFLKKKNSYKKKLQSLSNVMHDILKSTSNMFLICVSNMFQICCSPLEVFLGKGALKTCSKFEWEHHTKVWFCVAKQLYRNHTLALAFSLKFAAYSHSTFS